MKFGLTNHFKAPVSTQTAKTSTESFPQKTEIPDEPVEVKNLEIPFFQKTAQEYSRAQQITLLQRGQKVPIPVKNLAVGVGWQHSGGGMTQEADVSVFMLDASEEVPHENDFVFYNNPISLDGSVKLSSKDERNGSKSKESAEFENVKVMFSWLDPKIRKLVLCLTFDNVQELVHQSGRMQSLYLRFTDMDTEQEIYRFLFDFEPKDAGAIMLLEIYQRNEQWRINPMGTAITEDLSDLCDRFGLSTQ